MNSRIQNFHLHFTDLSSLKNNNNYVISFQCCSAENKRVHRSLKYIDGFITPTWSSHWFNKWVQSISLSHQSNFTDSQWKTYSCCHQWIVTANQSPFTDSDLESTMPTGFLVDNFKLLYRQLKDPGSNPDTVRNVSFSTEKLQVL